MFHSRGLAPQQNEAAFVAIERHEILIAIAAARAEGFFETEKALIDLLWTLESSKGEPSRR